MCFFSLLKHIFKDILDGKGELNKVAKFSLCECDHVPYLLQQSTLCTPSQLMKNVRHALVSYV